MTHEECMDLYARAHIACFIDEQHPEMTDDEKESYLNLLWHEWWCQIMYGEGGHMIWEDRDI